MCFSKEVIIVHLIHCALGPKLLETKLKPQIGENVKIAEFNETLSMLATVYKNKQTGAFVERNVVYLLSYHYRQALLSNLRKVMQRRTLA